LAIIIKRSAAILNITITDEAAFEIASRSRGTPRIANRMLKRVRDHAIVQGSTKIDRTIAKNALDKMDIDMLGLDDSDRKLLLAMIEKFDGGPVGVETLSAATGEESVTIEDVIEPYLLQLGFLSRTPRGRMVLPAAYKHLELKPKTVQMSIDDMTIDNNG